MSIQHERLIDLCNELQLGGVAAPEPRLRRAYSARSKDGLIEVLTAAGFANACLVQSDLGFCVLAVNDDSAAKT